MLRNEFRLTGHLGKDRKIRVNENTGDILGLAFSLAVRKSSPDPAKPGEWIDDTDWFPITVSASNKSFEYLKKHLLKGAHVQVGGYLRRASWESKNRRDEVGNALTDFRTDIHASDIQIIRYAKNDVQENQESQDEQNWDSTQANPIPAQDLNDEIPPGYDEELMVDQE
jgi:single-strand DNA-binding protein